MSTQVALITGASSGIGLELAKLFAADRFHLLLVARRADLLDTLADDLRFKYGATVDLMPCDLSRPGAADALADEIESRGLPVDVVVNNAGFGASGPLAEMGAALVTQMLEVNVAALTTLTRRFLPAMLARESGGILNVASVAGFMPGPYMAAYYASKAYVLSFTLALAHEVRDKGVSVTCLAPGATRTEFFSHDGMQGSRLTKLSMQTADEVARIGYRALQKGKVLAVCGFNNRLLTLFAPLLPNALSARIVARLNR